jgi:hypothetical protein
MPSDSAQLLADPLQGNSGRATHVKSEPRGFVFSPRWQRASGEEEGRIKRCLTALCVLLAVGVFAPRTVAAGPTAIGNGTFNGMSPGSHFGFAVIVGASVRGHFACNMAGNSPFDGLRLTAPEGTVTSGTASVVTGTATFAGTATLRMDNEKSTIGFEVEIHGGDPLAGWLHLTAFDSPFGPVFAFPPEHVLTGQISVH